MSMEENDAATVLSQMSQLGCPPFDISSSSVVENDAMLDADAIGATCTLQPSSLRNDFISQFDNGFESRNDPYIGFDDAEHPYAVSSAFSNDTLSMKAMNPDVNNSVAQPTNPLMCTLCKKLLRTQQAMDRHVTICPGRRTHTCQICTRTFTTKSDLKRHHMVHEKPSEKKYKCEICCSTMRDQASKTRHMKTHKIEKSFKCSICGKEFSRCDSYKEHVRTHNAKKMFRCKFCSSEFNYKNSYNRHVKSHQMPTLLSCDICEKTFRRQDCLKKHKKQAHSKITKSDNQLCGTPVEKANTESTCHSSKKGNQTGICESQRRSRNRKTKRLEKLSKYCSDQTKSSQNAVPILMSMAENAANCFNRRTIVEDSISSAETSSIISELSLSSPPQSDFMNLLDESSTEEECDSVASDELQICLDNCEEVVSHVSCIVTNPCT